MKRKASAVFNLQLGLQQCQPQMQHEMLNLCFFFFNLVALYAQYFWSDEQTEDRETEEIIIK